LDRWIANPRLGFPKPVVINKRRYFREQQLKAWEITRATTKSVAWMIHKKSARPTTAAANREPLRVDHAGRPIGTIATSKQDCLQVIRAEIIGENVCRAEGYTVRAAAPVLAACRELIAIGYNPNRVLLGYRGDVLCIIVTSIGAAASLTVDQTRTSFARWQPLPSAVVSLDIARHKSSTTSPAGTVQPTRSGWIPLALLWGVKLRRKNQLRTEFVAMWRGMAVAPAMPG
jgi:hypothetical protein